MDELSLHVAFIVDFFPSEVCLSWESDLVSFLYFDDNKDWESIVSTHDLVYLNIIFFGVRARGVPSNDFFFPIDLAHHSKHFLMVDVIKEPDIRLLQILLERNCIAICDFKHAFVAIFTQQNSNNTFFCTLSYSIIVINN